MDHLQKGGISVCYSLNERACRIIEENILPHLDALGVQVHVLKNGATVLDMGVFA